jgi:hypothetical protein
MAAQLEGEQVARGAGRKVKKARAAADEHRGTDDRQVPGQPRLAGPPVK